MKSFARIDPLRWFKAICICSAIFVAIQFFLGRGIFDPSPNRISYAYDGAEKPSAAALCRHHGWEVFMPRLSPDSTKRKVYDLIMVNDELDWLEIRLNTTYDYVDYFVIVEAQQTFTGHPKPLAIKNNFDRLKPYHSKIIYHLLEYPAEFNPKRTWDREDLQRDATFTQVFPGLKDAQAPSWGDVLVVADVDEIPRPETLRVLRSCAFPRRLTLRSRFYYYGFQFLHRGPDWAHPQATYYEGSTRTIKPTNLRNGDGGLQPLIYWDKADLWNAGWHCSSCFRTMGELLNKMGSFSHVWMNSKEYRDRDRIADRIRNGKDLWDRAGQVYDKVEGNRDVPPILLREPEKFKYLLDRDGPTAGFEDYHGP
ncbi:glycosyl transferase family 17 protein [Coniochaeta ligniaria NRRL 30616]|uniref:Glycosyl transferase family 17 protein n=1 Tax=Coniochaeta ligniaria NRRL 30616 TaxID=1408157 RepID=A0A1J7JXF1_9PEZI|nr:glycosyl transferase family 17 protein [Coniochaeta ligniaria NRRL 30616]